ncbi:carboxypeptidase-like regulatory domain-containing protein [uncultured Lacinutrix sp.]|uniref:carboxypeptidase-like regulatory domain-containing protein n=1 Tax=uncultured Lacinutrix sp. TaxID=574032 RepID=UPI00261B6836|nr:carboxypeptidase-like regulatory domain-containing protein [uncultured Lacinutrix sp.]
MKRIVAFTVFCIATFISSYGQEYFGKILDSKSNEPLEGVSIYFDGTTIGTTTNYLGKFKIETKQSIEASLVVSFLGYKTKVLNKVDLKQEELIVYLEVEPMTLAEVVIEEDNWSREKKWKYFKQEFLGKTLASNQCKFLNSKDIRLVYSKSENKLFASSKNPIQIINKSLGYRIDYNLVDFEIVFIGNKNFIRVERVYYSGTSQFREINEKKIKKKYVKARENVYNGSFLHFMRCIANESLAENKFQLYIKPEPRSKQFVGISPTAVFKTKKLKTKETEVIINRRGKITIMYKGFSQSGITLEDEETTFKIDGYGNYYPIYKLLVSGEFGKNRISSMLPSNYGID